MALSSKRFYYRGVEVRVGDVVRLAGRHIWRVDGIIQPGTPGCCGPEGGIVLGAPRQANQFISDPLVNHDLEFISRAPVKKGTRTDGRKSPQNPKPFFYRGVEVKVGDIVRMPTGTTGVVHEIRQPSDLGDLDPGGGVMFRDPDGFGWLEEDPWFDEDLEFLGRAGGPEGRRHA